MNFLPHLFPFLCLLYLNLAPFETNKAVFELTILHELTHIYQYTANIAAIRFSKAHEEISHSSYFITEMGKLEVLTPNLIFRNLRIVIRQLFEEFWCEGLAYLFQYAGNEKELLKIAEKPEESLSDMYYMGTKEAKQFLDIWNIIFKALGKQDSSTLSDMTDMIKDLRRRSASIGLSMAFTILYESKTPKEMTDMSPFQFINAYEVSALKLKLKPLVTLTSGTGLIDYNRMLAQLTALYKQYEKAGKLDIQL